MGERINGLIYDCEIINCVPGKGTTFKKEKGFNYCRDWDDFKGMGIACICAWDLWLDVPRVFTQGNFSDFSALVKEREEIIGFNSLKFDDKLIAACLSHKVTTTYDLMVEAKAACGSWGEGNTKGVFGLGALAEANGMPGKTEKGAKAPMMWQTGQHGRVIDYCLNDVILVRDLLHKRDWLTVNMYGQSKAFRLAELRSLREQRAEAEKQVKQAQRGDW